MTRAQSFASLENPEAPFDVLVIGGGATGLGIAVDSATRGFRTVLVEAGDFAQATSSRATKLVHGGVRYLASGQIHLVYEALHERAVMLRNAPHLVRKQAFLLPTYKWRDLPFYGAGLLLYDLISGRSSMGRTKLLSRRKAVEQIPNLSPERLTGGVLYYDGQFNDARLALALAQTAADHGATVLNYARCSRFVQSHGKLASAVVQDVETGAEYTIHAKVIFNASGIFTDEVRRMDDASSKPLLTVSRGTHVVLSPEVLGGGAAIMVPKTEDGRVIFAIPWEGRVLVGTTDLAADRPLMEPGHTEEEIQFLLNTLNPFLAKKVTESDILSVFSGLRPLVTRDSANTAKLSREHTIELSPQGLITITGGKWTTYRRMAEDALQFAAKNGMLEHRPCVSGETLLHGAAGWTATGDPYNDEYGSDAAALLALVREDASLAEFIDPELPYNFAQVLFAARAEHARTVEDVLSRRTRALLLSSRAAMRAAEKVAEVIAKEHGFDAAWQRQQVEQFSALAREHYSR